MALSTLFPLAAWLVGGVFGFVTGMVIVGSWWILRPRPGVLWALSIVLLAAAPATMIGQGLPETRVVGAEFGAEHLLAHRMVIASLALAGFASLTELLGLRSSRGR